MTLHQLKVFITVAKIKSFTQAAERLGVRQPSVSLVIKDLEQSLQVRLFEKLGHRIRLTAAGELLLEEAGEILARVDGMKERMDELKGLKRGKLSIGGSPSAAASFLPFAVESFKKQFAWVELSLKIDRSARLEKNLLEGNLDVAVMGLAPHSPLLIGEFCHEEEIIAVAAPSHPLAGKRSVPLIQLAKESMITQEKGGLIRTILDERFARLGIPFVPKMELSPEVGARDAIRSAVAGGLGIGFITKCHVLADLESGRLKQLKVPDLKLKRSNYIVVHKSRQGSALVQAFIKALKREKGRS